MSMVNKRLTPPDENVNGEGHLEETIKEKAVIEDSPVFPNNYLNPFNDKEQEAFDGYPYIFSDVDFFLLRNPQMFKGFDKIVMTDEDRQTASKSFVARIWQYDRWRMWKYTYELPFEQYIINRGDGERPDDRATVSMNGVVFYILKGVEIKMPKNVKQILMESQGHVSIIGQESLLASISHKLDPITGLPKDPSRLEM